MEAQGVPKVSGVRRASQARGPGGCFFFCLDSESWASCCWVLGVWVDVVKTRARFFFGGGGSEF